MGREEGVWGYQSDVCVSEASASRTALLFGWEVVAVTRGATSGLVARRLRHMRVVTYGVKWEPRDVHKSLILKSTPQAPHCLGEQLMCSHIDRARGPRLTQSHRTARGIPMP